MNIQISAINHVLPLNKKTNRNHTLNQICSSVLSFSFFLNKERITASEERGRWNIVLTCI